LAKQIQSAAEFCGISVHSRKIESPDKIIWLLDSLKVSGELLTLIGSLDEKISCAAIAVRLVDNAGRAVIVIMRDNNNFTPKPESDRERFTRIFIEAATIKS
jgi:hypothetical protein